MSKVSFSSQSRLFHLVIYSDSSSYSTTDILKKCSQLQCCSRWAWCLHDKDLNDDGELKKAHIHLVLQCKYPVKYSFIVSSLGCVESSVTLPNAFSKTRTFRSLVRYLIHADSPKKYQYEISDIHCNFDLSSYFDEISVDLHASAFMDLLDFMSTSGVTRRNVAVYACQSGLITYYRMYYTILWDIFFSEDVSARINYENLLKTIDKYND